MPKEVTFDSEYATLWFDSDLKAVCLRHKKAAPAEVVRDLLCRGGDLLAMEGARKWLSDSRENSRPPAGIEEWAVGTWLPQTLRAGWRFWAVVAPLAKAAQEAMQHHVSVYRGFGLTVRVFSDPDEAAKWLAEQ